LQAFDNVTPDMLMAEKAAHPKAPPIQWLNTCIAKNLKANGDIQTVTYEIVFDRSPPRKSVFSGVTEAPRIAKASPALEKMTVTYFT